LYSTCLFCHSGLGANDAIETFPIGRRLAVDSERGRVWVNCSRCERWNLTPIEERGEAVERCEELFRASRLRASTSNIGLARVAHDLELVRIGRPLLPEMAAWRYGDQFGRRLRRSMLAGAGALTVIGGGLIGGVTVAASALAVGTALNLLDVWRRAHVALQVPAGDGIRLALTEAHVRAIELRRESRDRWSLGIPHRHWGYTIQSPAGRRHIGPVLWIEGDAALRAAARILPFVNRQGASDRRVRDAVRFLESHGTGTRAFLVALDGERVSRPSTLRQMPRAVRLALEMAANEDIERQFLEGDLRALEAAWREAEEIASIADTLPTSLSVL
jgi:hypothetical protein